MKLLKTMPDALRKQAAQDVPVAGEDKLDRIRAKVKEARDVELRIDSMEEAVKELKKDLNRIRCEELPALFQQNGVPSITIDREGNAPAYVAELQAYYHANIPDPEKDPAGAEAGYAWLKANKLESFIKTQVKVDYGRGERAKAKKFEAFLKKEKIPYSSKVGVPWNTLTAEVRRRYEAGKPLSPADLTAIGGTVGTVVKITAIKEKK
jgi:hypothetical protein